MSISVAVEVIEPERCRPTATAWSLSSSES
jgi:hypothetical protein